MSRLCRALVGAVGSSQRRDVLDDAAVDHVLEDIRRQGHAARASQMLGAMILFAHDRLNSARAATGAPPITFADLEAWATRETGIDPALTADCLAIVREMARPSRRTTVLQERIDHAVGTWGPYALATEALVYLRIVARAAAGAGIEVDYLVQCWALSDELLLTGSSHPPPSRRRRRND